MSVVLNEKYSNHKMSAVSNDKYSNHTMCFIRSAYFLFSDSAFTECTFVHGEF